MTVETQEQLEKLHKIGQIVAQTIRLMGSHVQPGITTKELDEIGRAYLKSCGAQSAPELVYNFPGATCISVNHEVAHGIPGSRCIQPGDMVNIDVSAECDGFFGDAGYTFLVEPVIDIQRHIATIARKALERAIAQVRAGQPLNVIGRAIETTAQENGCSVILNIGSHGVGSGLHEEPLFIPSFYDESDERRMHEGMVITIEPFISSGAWEVGEADDGWTLCTAPGFYTAQFEHTMVVTKSGAHLMTELPAVS